MHGVLYATPAAADVVSDWLATLSEPDVDVLKAILDDAVTADEVAVAVAGDWIEEHGGEREWAGMIEYIPW